MKFERKSRYHEASDCGRYTVCAIGPKPYRFEAFRGKQCLAYNLDSAAAAREICRRDCESLDTVPLSTR